MGEPHVPQPLDGQDLLDSLPHEREDPAQPRVEEQRMLVHDEVLVEGKTAGDRGQGRVDPVDVLGDFVDARSRFDVRDHDFPPLPKDDGLER